MSSPNKTTLNRWSYPDPIRSELTSKYSENVQTEIFVTVTNQSCQTDWFLHRTPTLSRPIRSPIGSDRSVYVNGGMTFEDMCAVTDEQLFSRLINDTNHLLHRLLPPPTTASQHYNLRPRRHTLQLPEHHTRLLDNFFVRMLYKHSY